MEISIDQADMGVVYQMLTLVTQPLPSEAGDEKTALDSVYSPELPARFYADVERYSSALLYRSEQVVRPFTAKQGESLSITRVNEGVKSWRIAERFT